MGGRGRGSELSGALLANELGEAAGRDRKTAGNVVRGGISEEEEAAERHLRGRYGLPKFYSSDAIPAINTPVIHDEVTDGIFPIDTDGRGFYLSNNGERFQREVAYDGTGKPEGDAIHFG